MVNMPEIGAGSNEIGTEATGSIAGEDRRWRKAGGGVPTKAASRLTVSKVVIGKRIKNSEPLEGPSVSDRSNVTSPPRFFLTCALALNKLRQDRLLID